MTPIGAILDIRTLSLINIVFTGAYAIGLLLFGGMQRRYKGLMAMGVANSALCAGFYLLALRGITSTIISVILANALILGGFVFFLAGTLRFRRQSRRMMVPVVVGYVLVLLLLVYWTYVQPDIRIRVLAVSVSLSLICVLTGLAYLRKVESFLLVPSIIASIAFFQYGAFNVLRFIITFGGPRISDFMLSDSIHGLAFVFLQVMVTLNAFSVVWIASADMAHSLRDLSRIDPLTGCLNRRALLEDSERELSRIQRSGTGLAAVMADIDRFKEFNDRYGHSLGDEVLRHFAEIVGGQLRGPDLLARYGGEEFVLILPDTNLKAATSVANRVRAAIENAVVVSEKNDVSITASFGVSEVTGRDDTISALLDRADLAMYKAKTAGRNQVDIQD